MKRKLNRLYKRLRKSEAQLISRINKDNWEAIFKQLMPIQRRRIEIYNRLNYGATKEK